MQFEIRIEMHNKTADDYERLHQNAASLGLSRFITGTDGVRYMLPTGTYWIETNFDGFAVAKLAQKAVLGIDPTAEITVGGNGPMVFFNLKPAPTLAHSLRALSLRPLVPPPAPMTAPKAFGQLEALYGMLHPVKTLK